MTRTAALVFTLTFLFVILRCEKAEGSCEVSNQVVSEVQSKQDTIPAEPDTIDIPSLEALQLGKVDLETRLADLLGLIEQKERSLLAKEERLAAQQETLGELAETLARRENRLSQVQVLAGIVFILGLAGIVIGFVIGRGKAKKAGSGVDFKAEDRAETKPKATAKKKTAKPKPEKRDEAGNVETNERKDPQDKASKIMPPAEKSPPDA